MGTPQHLSKRVTALDTKVNTPESLVTKLDNYLKDANCGLIAQLDRTKRKVETLEKGGIFDIPQEVKSLEQRIHEIEVLHKTHAEKADQVRSNVELAGDLIQRKEHEVKLLAGQVEELQRANMANTLVISGLAECPNETPEQAVQAFSEVCHQHLGLPEISGGVLSVYRVGTPTQLKIRGKMMELPRILMVHCAPKLRMQIMKKKSVLATVPMVNGLRVYINQQVPLATKVKQDQMRAEVRAIKEKNKLREPNKQIQYKFEGDKLLINNQVVRPAVAKPQPVELLFPDDAEIQA